MLILTILIFYVSRVGLLQLDLKYFAYPEYLPSTSQMSEILFVLLLVSASMLAGCMIGESVGPNRKNNYKMFLWSNSIKDEHLYYLYLALIFIFSKLILLYLFLDSGVGVGIDRQLFDPILLRVAKLFKLFGFLGVIPVCWFIVKKPRGFERRITLLAVTLMVLTTITSGSKTALLYAILPFIMVYFVTGIPIPRRQAVFFKWVVILSIVVIFPLMAVSRIYFAAILAGTPVSFSDVVGSGLDISAIILGFASRVGSSFDVLAFIVSTEDLFIPYADLTAEFIDVINGYYPGGIFAVDAPQWARILYAVGHNADLAAITAIGTGENITLPAHLYINFKISGVCFWLFFIMLMYGMIFNYMNIIFVRVFIISSLIFDISNGSGFVSMILNIPFMFLYMILLHASYKIALPFIGVMKRKTNSSTLQNHLYGIQNEKVT